MLFDVRDFNGADTILQGPLQATWAQLDAVIKAMPLHLKASDQDGKQGTPIFDPVGTNEHLKRELTKHAIWKAGVPIPAKYDFLGKDVDFMAGSVLVEAQFSNYPFLLNNLLRSELFFKGGAALGAQAVQVAIIITKAKMFDASNSTLYYEQAEKQVAALSELQVFEVPIRLVGLKSPVNATVDAAWTTYDASRYSRTVLKRDSVQVKVVAAKTARGRATIER